MAKPDFCSDCEELAVFENMWACRETVRDGECEYGCEFLVKASNLEEAERRAWEYVKRNYILDNGKDDKPYTAFLNEDGWMEIDGDYRWTQAEVRRQITSLAELLEFIPYVKV
ncbi:hypothetical protein LCGC14_0732700 [marine sediment metagenome]|uniref:Uncharacterized protein n=1 Tax=marine sediment metagenome TaxID=412755 RepID=A0A0F9SU65_9ZZZZ